MNVKKESEKKKNRAKYSRQIQLEKKKKMDDEIKLQVSMMTRKMRGELSRVIRELSLPPPPEKDIISVYSLYFTCFPWRAISRFLRRFAN